MAVQQVPLRKSYCIVAHEHKLALSSPISSYLVLSEDNQILSLSNNNLISDRLSNLYEINNPRSRADEVVANSETIFDSETTFYLSPWRLWYLRRLYYHSEVEAIYGDRNDVVEVTLSREGEKDHGKPCVWSFNRFLDLSCNRNGNQNTITSCNLNVS